MKVMFCLPDFAALGVQRVVAALARAWPAPEELVLCVHEARGELPPAGVRVIELSKLAPDVPKLRVLARPLLHWRALAKERPAAVVSFVPGDNLSLLALRKLPGAPRFGLAVSEHIHVTSQLPDYALRFRLPYRALFPRWYPEADAIVCIAEESREDLVLRWKLPREKMVLIHNPIDLDAVRGGARAPAESAQVIYAGRLEKQKRVDRLLEAAARAKVRLDILGDGPLREELQAQAQRLGVEARFHGFVKNPWALIARAQVFALPSDYEGFPCVLAEALALGTPIVSTDCPSGPREILDQGRAGLLVARTAEALAAGIQQALNSPAEARARAEHGRGLVEQYGAKAVAQRYYELCQRISR